MSTVETSLKQLLIEIGTLLDSVRHLKLHYSLDRNLINAPASPETWHKLLTTTAIPPQSPLAEFFLLCDGVRASDVCNGYWIHNADIIIGQFCSGEPIRITAPISVNILVIGSDGGGGRFAIDRNNWSDVFYMSEGMVTDATFDGDECSVELVANSFSNFLIFLRNEITEFVHNRQIRDGTTS